MTGLNMCLFFAHLIKRYLLLFDYQLTDIHLQHHMQPAFH